MTTSRTKALLRNKRYLFWTKFFLEFKTLQAIIALFYISRGLTLEQIVYLGIVWSVTALIVEVPTGYLADKVGRKKTIQLAVVTTILSTGVLYLAHGFVWFVFVTAMFSLAYALISGTDEALIYEGQIELKDETGAQRVAGKYLSSGRFAKIFLPFLGAYIARDLVSWQFNILITINLIGSLIAFYFATRIIEPKRQVGLAEQELGVYKNSLKILTKNKDLFKIVVNKIIVFIGCLAFWKVYQPILKGVGMSTETLGLIYVFVMGLLFVNFWFSDVITKKLGSGVYMNLPVIAGVLSVLLFLATDNLWILFVSTVVANAVGTIRDPLFIKIIHKRLRSYSRATTTSMLNFVKGILDIPILLATGWLAGVNNSYALFIPLGLFIFAVLVIPIKNKDLSLVVK